MTKHSLIRAALEALWVAQAPKWFPAPRDVAGFALTLHHVAPGRNGEFQPNALLSITPEFLDRLLGHLKARGFRFVNVDELVRGAASGSTDPRRLAVTLDDGYRDNLEHAWPVFRRHAVPFTIYVCAGFCDRTSELWWEALDRIIATADSVPRPGDQTSKDVPTRRAAEKRRIYELWKDWLTTEVDETRQRSAIRQLCERYGLDLSALARELVMDWNEVRRIAGDPLVSIGAHTLTHPALARLTPSAAFHEMRKSADRIEAEIGRRPSSLAFPYGHPAAAGAREAGLAEQAGFSASFTTRPGYIPANGARQGLPRVSVNGFFQHIRYVETLLTPGLWSVQQRIAGKTTPAVGPASAST